MKKDKEIVSMKSLSNVNGTNLSEIYRQCYYFGFSHGELLKFNGKISVFNEVLFDQFLKSDLAFSELENTTNLTHVPFSKLTADGAFEFQFIDITMKDLAKLYDVNPSTISRWTSFEIEPPFDFDWCDPLSTHILKSDHYKSIRQK